MSDPRYPAGPAKVRPASVTISSYLLLLVAVLQVLNLVLSITMMGAIEDVYREAFAGTPMADQAGMFAIIGVVFGTGIGVLVAVGLVVLAVLNNRGKNPARIVTWVLGGLYFCCSGVGLGLSAAGSALNFGAGAPNAPNAPSQAEIQRMLANRLPAWYEPVSTASSVLVLVALLVALILLALPASNEFFRKPQTVWEPPVPGSTYPGYPPPAAPPGYPPAGPGYPPAGPSGPPAPPGS